MFESVNLHSVFQAISQWGRSKKQAMESGRGLFFCLPDSARRPFAFSID